ncbi:MAG: hypothetical protein HYU66_15755 [Armatimonadetes bacterium]|nr:hypothetical protein [Armatimonadota bacterium]
MTAQRPPAVLYTAAFQVLTGLIWLVQAADMPSGFMRWFLVWFGASHFVTAYGLWQMSEWGRQRALQIAVLDVLGVLQVLLFGQISPYGALLRLGMPLYSISVLRDRNLRQRFN